MYKNPKCFCNDSETNKKTSAKGRINFSSCSNKKKQTFVCSDFVPGTGLEPAHPYEY